VYGPFNQPLAPADVASIRAAIKSVHPGRLVTASNSPVNTAAFAADFTSQMGLDFTAYHDPRVDNWYQFDRVQSIVGTLRSNGRPVYLQEPTRYPFPSTDRARFFQEAMANAKLAGASAWCLHTDLAFDLGDSLFQNKIESRQEPEGVFVNSLIPRV